MFGINFVEFCTFIKNPSYTFNIFNNDSNSSLLERIELAQYKLGDLCAYISPGIDGKKDKYVSSIPYNNQYKKLLFGKNIKRYRICFEDNYILYDRKVLNRARKEIIFLSEKVITQRISGGDRPLVAAYDNNCFYTFNSVNNIILKTNSPISHKTLTAILNSNVLNWYYANKFSNKATLTVNISKTYLAKLPIPKIPNIDLDKLDYFVSNILGMNMEQDWQNEIDNIVYHLYGLTYDEVLIVDPNPPFTREEYETA